MRAVAGLTQLVDCSAGNHFAAVQDKRLQDFLEVKHFWLVVIQRHHINPEYSL